MLQRRNCILAVLVSLFSGLACAPPAADEAATPEESITKVWAASKFLQDKGASGFASLNSQDGIWTWKDSYVFAFDCRFDRMVAHPTRPDLVGRPIMQITDNNGKYIFIHFQGNVQARLIAARRLVGIRMDAARRRARVA